MISKFNIDDSFDQQFKISQELVSDFVKLSNDRNPLHTIEKQINEIIITHKDQMNNINGVINMMNMSLVNDQNNKINILDSHYFLYGFQV